MHTDGNAGFPDLSFASGKLKQTLQNGPYAIKTIKINSKNIPFLLK
jgi:hypothetical protein